MQTIELKFNPDGWISNMATDNFKGWLHMWKCEIQCKRLWALLWTIFLGGGGAVGGRLKNFNIIDVHRKFWFLGGTFMKN